MKKNKKNQKKHLFELIVSFTLKVADIVAFIYLIIRLISWMLYGVGK